MCASGGEKWVKLPFIAWRDVLCHVHFAAMTKHGPPLIYQLTNNFFRKKLFLPVICFFAFWGEVA